MSTRLPDGFQVRLHPGLHRLADGHLLVGGSPLTAMWLSEKAAATLGAGGHGALTVDSPGTAVLAGRLLDTNMAEPVLQAEADPHQITVVIPVRDRAEQLDRALTGLAGLNCIVIDDASRDVDALREVTRRHGAQLVSLPVNVGPAGARNAGLARVTTPYVAFIDSDVTATSKDLTRLTVHFADPAVALVGPRIHGISRTTRPRWFQRYDEVASSLTLGTAPASVRPGAHVAWLPSACLIGRTQTLRDSPIGGFDPAMRVGEDVDLVWRLIHHGARVRYDPTVTVHHDTRDTLRAWAGRKFAYGTSSAELARRHGDHTAPADLSPTLAIAAAAVLTRHRMATPICAAAILWSQRRIRNSLRTTAGRDTLALRLAVRGLGWAIRQESALLLRHWWPLTVLAAPRLRPLRRSVATALVIDTLLTTRSLPTSIPFPTAIMARRVDDLAYGAGLWAGSFRTRTSTALAPRWPKWRPPTAPRRGDSSR